MEFSARPTELAAAAGPFDEAAGIAAEALAALRSTLDGLGAYLGTDEQGRTFAAQYEPKAAEGLAAVEHEARAVRSLGDALRGSAQQYTSDEAGLAEGLRPP